jgi:hypothetical protein
MKLKFTLTVTVEDGTVDSDYLAQNLLDGIERQRMEVGLTDPDCDGRVTEVECKYEGVLK